MVVPYSLLFLFILDWNCTVKAVPKIGSRRQRTSHQNCLWSLCSWSFLHYYDTFPCFALCGGGHFGRGAGFCFLVLELPPRILVICWLGNDTGGGTTDPQNECNRSREILAQQLLTYSFLSCKENREQHSTADSKSGGGSRGLNDFTLLIYSYEDTEQECLDSRCAQISGVPRHSHMSRTELIGVKIF